MPSEFRYQFGEQIHIVTVEPQGDRFLVRVGDAVFNLAARAGEAGRLDLDIDGQRVRAYAVAAAGKAYVALAGESYTLRTPDERRRRAGGADASSGRLTAVMPGRVLDVLVAVGDVVAKGATLVLLEAMKMELRINAPLDGRVTKVACAPGQVVERDQPLVELQADPETR